MTKDGRPLFEPEPRETIISFGVLGVLEIGFLVFVAVVAALAIHPIISVAIIMAAIGIYERRKKRRYGGQ